MTTDETFEPAVAVCLEGALRAVRVGARNVVERPVDDSVLINNISAADLEVKLSKRQQVFSRNKWEFDSLSLTEKAIFIRVIEGRINKEVARELEVGLRLVDFGRRSLC